MTSRPPLRETAAAPELSADMTPADLAFELKQLQFERYPIRWILIDRDARDYLVAALTRQPTRRT